MKELNEQEQFKNDCIEEAVILWGKIHELCKKKNGYVSKDKALLHFSKAELPITKDNAVGCSYCAYDEKYGKDDCTSCIGFKNGCLNDENSPYREYSSGSTPVESSKLMYKLTINVQNQWLRSLDE